MQKTHFFPIRVISGVGLIALGLLLITPMLNNISFDDRLASFLSVFLFLV